MNWLFQFLNSSIGKKISMATTGFLLCLFLIIHIVGNLFLFVGPEAFNRYVGTLSIVKPLVRLIEIILGLIFLLHIVNSVWLFIINNKSNPVKYEMNLAGENSSFFSRNMTISGIVIFIFLVIHLRTFWYQFQVEHGGEQFYSIVMSDTIGFGNLTVTIIYIIAMFLLGFHLRHGFQSAFQTFGIRYNKYGSLIKAVAVFFWLIIPLVFISIPIYFGLLRGGF